MLNTTVVVNNKHENKTIVEPDKRMSIQVEPGYKLTVVRTDSEQYEEFTSGNPYLLEPKKVVKGMWVPRSGYEAFPRYDVFQEVKIYLTQKVELRSIEIDNFGKAYITYKEVEGEPKYYKTERDERFCPIDKTPSEFADELVLWRRR